MSRKKKKQVKGPDVSPEPLEASRWTLGPTVPFTTAPESASWWSWPLAITLLFPPAPRSPVPDLLIA